MPEEWADLLNKEGEYLGACCANISRVRDILMDAIREDHEIRAEELTEAAELIKGHGCELYDSDHPLTRLVALYDEIKDHLREGNYLFQNSFDPDDPDQAIKAFATYASHYSDYSFQMRMGGDDADPDRRFNDCVNREKALIDMIPVVYTLMKKLHSLSIGSFGYGLIDKEGKVAYSRSGLAIYKDEKFANELCERWNREEAAGRRKKAEELEHCTACLHQHGSWCGGTMKHCIYRRSPYLFGWLLWGWYLIKIYDEDWITPDLRQTIRDNNVENYLAVYEMEPPLVWKFWFKPGKGDAVA